MTEDPEIISSKQLKYLATYLDFKSAMAPSRPWKPARSLMDIVGERAKARKAAERAATK